MLCHLIIATLLLGKTRVLRLQLVSLLHLSLDVCCIAWIILIQGSHSTAIVRKLANSILPNNYID